MKADVIVVGAGIAGLVTALGVADAGCTTIVLCKGKLGEIAATAWAQGGIAAALGEDDAPIFHARDTLQAAAGIADPKIVAVLTEEAPAAIELLVRTGVEFDRDASGNLFLGREAAHAHRRIVHAGGDATGRVVLEALVRAVRRTPEIRIVEGADARELIGNADGIGGVRALVDGTIVDFTAPAIVLATGGIGGLFAATTNPRESCGDGLALAMRLGAQCADLEFVQFHPTALAIEGADPMPLVTEALRGEGARLIDDRGEHFMLAVDPAAELAPRDVVARAIFAKINSGARVFLDAREALGERFPQRFPTVFAHCVRGGIDPRFELIPVAPAAHYHMGGIAVDALGRTSLVGLWACGEVSATGVHGANRLASNSLLEGAVFARRVASDISGRVHRRTRRFAREHGAHKIAPRTPMATAALRRSMYENVGVVRDEAGLRTTLEQLDRLNRERAEDPDRLLVARAITVAALERRESRGSHFRRDYPEPKATLAHRALIAVSA